MAIPTYTNVISQINNYIVTNGNNEITANVLNPILRIITDFTNNNIGDISTLTTSNQTTIVNAINSLVNDINNLTTGIKLHSGNNNPNEVPPAIYGIADFYILVDSLNAPLELFQFNGTSWISQISNNLPNEITQLGNLSLLTLPNRILIDTPPDGVWRINGNEYTRLVDTELEIISAGVGMYRKDIVVATSNNTYSLIQGVESSSNPFTPFVPNDSILVTEISIFENTVSEIIAPITGAEFIKKVERSEVKNVQSGVIDVVFDSEKTIIAFSNNVTVVQKATIDVTTYENKSYYFKNHQTIPITFKHLSNIGVGGHLFSFPNGVDFVLQPKEVIEFLGVNYTQPILEYLGVKKDVIGSLLEFEEPYVSGPQIFTLLGTITQVYLVHTQGPKLSKSQYNIILPNQVEILHPLEENDIIYILYGSDSSVSIPAYYTQAETDALLAGSVGTVLYTAITKSEIDILINGNNLKEGMLYGISGCDVGLYGGNILYLEALTVNKLATNGYGNFLNVNYSIGSIYDWSQPFDSEDFVVRNEIWGGKFWKTKNVSFPATTRPIDQLNLNPLHWELGYVGGDVQVISVVDKITYDYQNDFISSREDKSGNIVNCSFQQYNDLGKNPIKYFQWGNTNRVHSNRVDSSLFDIINQKGFIENNNVELRSVFNLNEITQDSILSFSKIIGCLIDNKKFIGTNDYLLFEAYSDSAIEIYNDLHGNVFHGDLASTTTSVMYLVKENGQWKEQSSIVLEFADNASAILGGLTAGIRYRTGDFLKVVH